jgi:hypothetical protein
MFVTLLEMAMFVRLSHTKNALLPIFVTLLGMMILVILVQFSNASSPMLVTLLGMLTFVKLVQPENAAFPRLVTLLGMATLVTCEPPRFANALLAMLVTGRLLVVAGIMTAPPEPVYAVMVIAPLLVVNVNCAGAATGHSHASARMIVEMKQYRPVLE